MRSLPQALNQARAHQPPAWSRFAVLCALLVLLCGLLMVDWNSFTTWGRSDIEVPRGVTSSPLPDNAAWVIVDATGIVRISSGDEMRLPVSSDEELRTAVRHIVAKYPDRPFVLEIDRDTPYAKVEALLAVLREGGAGKVYFHTELPSH